MSGREKLAEFLRWHHPSVSVDDLTPSTVRGYWRHRVACAGYPHCREPLHRTLLNEGPTHHTIYFVDRPRVGGRFASPYETWNEAVGSSRPGETP